MPSAFTRVTLVEIQAGVPVTQRKLTLWKRLSEKQEGVDRTTALDQMSEALACGASLYLAESGQIGCNGRDRNPSRLPATPAVPSVRGDKMGASGTRGAAGHFSSCNAKRIKHPAFQAGPIGFESRARYHAGERHEQAHVLQKCPYGNTRDARRVVPATSRLNIALLAE